MNDMYFMQGFVHCRFTVVLAHFLHCLFTVVLEHFVHCLFTVVLKHFTVFWRTSMQVLRVVQKNTFWFRTSSPLTVYRTEWLERGDRRKINTFHVRINYCLFLISVVEYSNCKQTATDDQICCLCKFLQKRYPCRHWAFVFPLPFLLLK